MTYKGQCNETLEMTCGKTKTVSLTEWMRKYKTYVEENLLSL